MHGCDVDLSYKWVFMPHVYLVQLFPPFRPKQIWWRDAPKETRALIKIGFSTDESRWKASLRHYGADHGLLLGRVNTNNAVLWEQLFHHYLYEWHVVGELFSFKWPQSMFPSTLRIGAIEWLITCTRLDRHQSSEDREEILTQLAELLGRVGSP